jgi:hypothetical protein
MERVKKAGGNLTNGRWGERLNGKKEKSTAAAELATETKMTQPGVSRIISLEDLLIHEDKAAPRFVINGEVYDGTPFLKDHPGGATSIIAATGRDSSDEFMAIREFFLFHFFHSHSLSSTFSLFLLSQLMALSFFSGLRNGQSHDAKLPYRAPLSIRPLHPQQPHHLANCAHNSPPYLS